MSSTPSWLVSFADQVALELTGFDLLSPIGCHSYFDDEEQKWELSLFAANTEAVSGVADGKLIPSNFTVDLQKVLSLFSEVHSIRWQALPIEIEDELGSHLSVEGFYEGHLVWLRILANPPGRFPRGRLAKVYDMQLEDLW